ncbi:hypothetical protein NU08_1825 [Flavobacterium anhuiense]|uniref:Uncharacterized protein n=1 Tax=Flavobacterium anhuiense TaxID=459526 RepID=A0A444VZG5_9FLAO|nr:hypothetical protein [Flavobacterium anhuiense]RYJ38987.1 hypothetical protein NU08_1825 [Flavobacterium anhuiense]
MAQSQRHLRSVSREDFGELGAYTWQLNTIGAPVNIPAYDSYRIEVGLWNKLLNGFN